MSIDIPGAVQEHKEDALDALEKALRQTTDLLDWLEAHPTGSFGAQHARRARDAIRDAIAELS